MNTVIEAKHHELSSHPVYFELNNLENIRTFMQYHVFAVWDFMSLLKSLQQKITCTDLPWIDSEYNPELVQLINEIVLGEESDVDQYGKPCSHFNLYLRGMKEIGADTSLIESFLKDFDFELLPSELSEIIAFHLNIALEKEDYEVASSFFFGREKLIPSMFESIVKVLKEAEIDCPTLIYYLERHIEVDGGEHGPKALKCLKELISTDEFKEKAAVDIAVKSLEKRWQLWDFILREIQA